LVVNQWVPVITGCRSIP